MTSPLAQPLTLPCGAVLANRIAKAAMSEGLADAANHATPRLAELYRRWAGSGAGLLLSGNIQIDPWHLERPGNVVLEDESGLAALTMLTRAGRSEDAHFWAQLSHTGRQVSDAINSQPLSPSTVQLQVLRGAGLSFAPPRAMTDAEIADVLHRFATAARLAIKAGFTGIALHGAHGYLISQFLSPLTNRRTDRWGGSLENRARFLIETLAAVRDAVGPAVPIGLKLNASDFLRGGFTHEECLKVVGLLNDTTLDLLELSGGSMEQPKVVGVAVKDQGVDGERDRSVRREAYFIAFAGDVRRIARMPVMVTGGFRSRAVMEAALAAGELDVVGLGRPLIADPLSPARLLAGEIDRVPAPEATLDLFHLLPWFNMQMERMADGLDPDLTMTGADAAARFPALEQAITEALLRHRAQHRGA